jgi:chromate transporter
MVNEGTPAEVLRAFLVLGLSSFGGPVAHLGYFRRAFVEQRGWLSDTEYAAIVALCQFLPGPASSQTGFCIGLRRAGWLGALAAWVGFTLPSGLLMFAAALGLGDLVHVRIAQAVLHGLQLGAIAVVAQAVVAMARSLCPDLPRRLFAVIGGAIMLLLPDTAGQLLVLVGGAIGGWLLLPGAGATATGPAVPADLASRLCLAGFAALLVFSLLAAGGGDAALFAAFFRTGALVFGGGHVVLPLLQDAVVRPGWVPAPAFLAGYGLAQAMPGPLFTIAAFLGALSRVGSGGAVGALVALVAIFLPGLLLAGGLLPHWSRLRGNGALASSLSGVNAAVVGLLGFALLNLITKGNAHSLWDAAIVVLAFLALMKPGVPPLAVILGCAAAAVI